MDVKSILDKIDADAREAAQKTLSDARASADELAAQSREQIQAQREAMEKRAQREGAETVERMRRMAELEDKKAALAVKRSVMDGAFREALGILESLPKTEARAFFLKELARAARGGEALLIGRVQPDWFDDAFLAEANALLLEKGVQQGVALSAEQIDGRGFHLRSGGAVMDCTFEALLADGRMALESDVAKALFE